MTVFKRLVTISFAAAVMGLLGWAYGPMATDPALTFKWEGFLSEKINFRDTGESINACLGRRVLPVGKILRSSHFFSGWPCSSIGNPDEIFSLDTFPADGRKFYCRDSGGLKVGHTFQTYELNNLEFIETWANHPDMAMAACKNIRGSLEALSAEKSVLIHCEAGRDRTGAVSALVAAFLLEQQRVLDEVVIGGIECDYRKSKSLKPEKYGRISALLKDIIIQNGSVHGFLAKYCGEVGADP
ncbi:MAG: tyrosine-protein phosphatase [Proteobacteria bacterium]|nr:tyrosine-protein phosphatase [Pseudomonadota bacterium]